jgi:hypothetical protein
MAPAPRTPGRSSLGSGQWDQADPTPSENAMLHPAAANSALQLKENEPMIRVTADAQWGLARLFSLGILQDGPQPAELGPLTCSPSGSPGSDVTAAQADRVQRAQTISNKTSTTSPFSCWPPRCPPSRDATTGRQTSDDPWTAWHWPARFGRPPSLFCTAKTRHWTQPRESTLAS